MEGELRSVVISGEASDDECRLAWEEIVQANMASSKSLPGNNHIRNHQKYNKILVDILAIRSSLFLLLVEGIDLPTIEWLKTQGYRIDIENGNAKFLESVTAGLNRSKNLNTKLESLGKTMVDQMAVSKESKATFAEVLASLHVHFPHASPDITLELFNEYKKIIDRKNQVAISHQNGRRRTNRA